MLFPIIAICACICTFFFARYWAVKSRLVEKKIDEVIARKIGPLGQNTELHALREEVAVMRNFLIDFVENEASMAGIASDAPDVEKKRRSDARIARRRELFGEAIFILQKANQMKPVKFHAADSGANL